MVYVYSRHLESGAEELCRICASWELAVEVIKSLYNLEMGYYYFAKERA